MSKKITGYIKLQIQAGQANPSPPVGPALGQHGVNIMEFCKAFNAKTQEMAGKLIPVEITVFADRSFTFITKTPPTSFLIMDTIKLKKGNFKIIEATDYGHTDILDDVWSDSVNDMMKSGTAVKSNISIKFGYLIYLNLV